MEELSSERWLTLRQAAKRLGIHYQTAYKMALAGALPARRWEGVGKGSIRISEVELQAWLDRQPAASDLRTA